MSPNLTGRSSPQIFQNNSSKSVIRKRRPRSGERYSGTGIRSCSAMAAAAAVLAAILSSKRSNAVLTLAGGPPSNRDRGGGRSNNMSRIHVARENITYKCNHQSPSLIPCLPAGALRAQSIVTPARSVWPWEAVDVRYFSWVSANPVRLMV